MNIGEKIKTLRIKKGLTLEEVGNKVGVGKSTVRKWETGIIANMRRDKIAALASALDTTPAYLMGWKDTSNPIRIPVFGEVAAGIPIEAITAIEDWEEISPDMASKGEYAALRIHGDSREPKM